MFVPKILFCLFIKCSINIKPQIVKLETCLQQANISYATQQSPIWSNLTAPYNLRLSYTPALVVLPTTDQQVGQSISCSAKESFKVQPKGGGHSYTSFSLGGQDGIAVVSMENFNEIEVDQTTFIAKIGAGQRLGNVALGIHEQGKRGLPHGTCPGVGIGGHATHGGYGYDSRLWGLALDTIFGLDVVFANGSIIYANETQNPDVYFAMRGAGDSFGIVTNFYMQTNEAPETVTYFTANLNETLKSIDQLTSAFLRTQDFVINSPLLTKNISFGFYTDNSGALSITGMCMFCNTTFFKETVFPALTEGVTPFPGSINITDLSWLDTLQVLAGADPLAEPLDGYNIHDTFYAKSVVTKEAEPLTEEAVRNFWEYIISKTNINTPPSFSIINLYGAQDSQINVPSPSASAYSDRESLWVFQNYGYTANHALPWDSRIIPLIDGLNAAIGNSQPTGNFSAYSKYIDPELTATQAAEQYFGPKTHDKLLRLKTELDPGFVFWNPQAVRNSGLLSLPPDELEDYQANYE